MSPSISIIMPVYNAKKYVGRAIKSILSQDFESFELILVNDGSTDGSDAICKEFAIQDSRIIIINQNNSGTSAARNAGLDAAKGKYITFCDHDDEYLPHLLRDNFALIEKEQADVLQFSINRIDTARPSQILHQKLIDQSIIASELRHKYLDIRLTENFMDVWNHFYLRETIQSIRFNPIYRHGFEDLDFNMHILKKIKKKLLFSSRIYYNHYLYSNSSGNSFCRKITSEIIKEYNTLFQTEYDLLDNFQDKTTPSKKKASNLLMWDLDFINYRINYKSAFELRDFYRAPLFSHFPIKVSWKTHLYLYFFFHSKKISQILRRIIYV